MYSHTYIVYTLFLIQNRANTTLVVLALFCIKNIFFYKKYTSLPMYQK